MSDHPVWCDHDGRRYNPTEVAHKSRETRWHVGPSDDVEFTLYHGRTDQFINGAQVKGREVIILATQCTGVVAYAEAHLALDDARILRALLDQHILEAEQNQASGWDFPAGDHLADHSTSECEERGCPGRAEPSREAA